MIGKIVASKAFGKGTISEVKENKITVAFESGTKVFKIPDAFDGFISTEDAELIAMIDEKREELRQAAIAKQEALKAKALEEEAAAQAVTHPAVQAVLPIKSAEFLDADEPVAFDKMSDLLNMCFGKQYKGWQHATWKPESKTFRVWMPKLAETEDGKLKAVAYGCLNVLSADGNTLVFDDLKADKYDGDIPEYDEDADIPALIFAKDPGNGRYIFRGVFMLDRSESSYLHYVFKRVATRIELIGWPVEKIKY